MDELAQQALADAHSRYQGYRDAAFHLTWECLSAKAPASNIRIMPIDRDALVFWQAICSFDAFFPDGKFPWDKIFLQVRSTPRRFDVAIWDGPLLCGMAVGKASRGKQHREHVCLKWVERFRLPGEPLKGLIALAAVTAADYYAKALRCQYVSIKNPLPAAIQRYRELGFELAGRRLGSTYYRRRVT